ncbi:MAG: pilus assembly protein PilP [Holophagaceae bacterium]|nr:pilus assembly protein PilP [Holophagaceae bacterium]
MTRRLFTIHLLSAIGLLAQAPAKVDQAPPASPVAPIEDVALIKATPYKPTIQRDPFSAPRDERPADALDVLDDIAVKGMIKKDGKNFAIVSDSRGNVRWLPVGHRFKDGEITAITDKAVTFHQWELNTTNRSIFRTITKTFKREEGKR